MALAVQRGGFATFGITDGAQIRDISPLLERRAIYYDLHFLGLTSTSISAPPRPTSCITGTKMPVEHPDIHDVCAASTGCRLNLPHRHDRAGRERPCRRPVATRSRRPRSPPPRCSR